MQPTTRGGFSSTGRTEFIADISLTGTNQTFNLPTNGGLIPNDRYMLALILTFEGRMTNAATGNPTGTLADAPWSLIDNVQIGGYHRPRGANEPFFNVRGPEINALQRLYTGAIPYLVPNSAGAPLFTPSLSTSANATNDIRFSLYIPFGPLRVGVGAQLAHLLDAPNYDQLKLTLQFADDKSVFSGQTNASTFSAFGSASGNARVRVEGVFALGGPSVYGFIPARTWRYYQENTSGDILTTVTNSRRYNIPRGNRVRNIMVKSGVKATTVTSGNNAYNTLSDTILSNLKIMRGLNKQIAYYGDFHRLKYETSFNYGLYPAQGYGLFDWAKRGSLREVLNTVGMVAGPSGDTDLYVQADIAGASNQADLYLIEEIRNVPVKLGR